MNLKNLSIFFMFGTISLGTAYANTPEQGDGLVEISGEIISQTCEVTSKNDQNVIQVPLPRIGAKYLSSAGKVAGTTPFTIQLTGCPASSDKDTDLQIGIYFSTQGPIGLGGTLENTVEGGAQNVNVQLLDSNKKAINLNNNIQSQTEFVQSKDSLTFQYYAQYYATGQATIGQVTAIAPFVIAYK